MLGTVRVLLTGCGAPGAFGIIKCLRNVTERKVEIVGVDANPLASCRKLVDSFHVVPLAGDSDFIPAIADVCAREQVDVALPIVTRELRRFADNRAVFDELGVRVVVMSSEALAIANNKVKLLSWMADHNLPTPQFVRAETADQVMQGIQTLGYPEKPVVVKQAEGNGSRGVRMLDASVSRYDLFFNEKPASYYIAPTELELVLRERETIPEMLVMEYLPGCEYSVDMAVLPDCVVGAVRKGLKVTSSIMTDSEIVDRKDIMDYCEAIATGLGAQGPISFDIKEREDGTPLIIEVNPRLAAGTVATAAAGLNIPYLAVKALIGEPIQSRTAELGVIMQRRYNEVFFDSNGNEIQW